MCCLSNPNKKQGYRLTVDGKILDAAIGMVNFGYEISFEFGSCE
jgi:hypothetical protein